MVTTSRHAGQPAGPDGLVGTEGGPTTRRVLEGLLGAPFTEDNQIDVLRNGAETFPAILDAVGAARRTVDLLWFAWGEGDVGRQVADVLVDRGRAGVRVRMLLDAYGAKDMDRRLLGRLRAAGCEVLFRHPVPSVRPTVWNLRMHSRVLVCDDSVALTGGTGIADAWTGHGDRPLDWRDTAFRVRGPAVAGLRAAFALSWLQVSAGRAGGFVVTEEDRFPPLPPAGRSAARAFRSSPAPGWNESAMAFAVLLATARHRVRLTSPYVRLPPWLDELLAATAVRGVHVQLLVAGPRVDRPSVHLQAERDYQPLLDAGVELWRYQPALLHTKVVTVDGAVAMGGTTNVDVRSVGLNEQICLLIADPAVVEVLDRHFEEDLASSRRLTAAEWRARPLGHRVREIAADVVGRPLRGWTGTGLVGPRPARW